MPIQPASSVSRGESASNQPTFDRGDGGRNNRAEFQVDNSRGDGRPDRNDGAGNRNGGRSERSEGRFEKGGVFADKGETRSDAKEAPQRSDRSDRAADQRTGVFAKFNLPLLGEGSSDKQVGLAQRSLNALGYGQSQADGNFGPRTADAVRSFQADNGLIRDGVIGNRETWPAMNKALVMRHEGLTRLGDAIGANRMINQPVTAEIKQLNTILVEFSDRAALSQRSDMQAPTLTNRPSGETIYVNRASESLADVSRSLGIPLQALIASNPEIEKPYLIMPGQEIVITGMAKERDPRKQPRQLHPADPDDILASSNLNLDFVARVNGIIELIRSEGFDVRVVEGFRTFKEQQQRFEQGRTASGAVVTDFEAGHSWHNYGLAVDFALNDEDGDPVWPEASSPFWQRLGDIALAHGTIWGGAFGYPAHVEFHPGFASGEARLFIEDFESYGLESVWARLAVDLSPLD